MLISHITIDTTATDGLQSKSQKRRAPLLLKRKALTTSFFDSSKIKSDGRKGSTSNASGGLIFGQPLEKCLSNDNAFGASNKQKGSDDSGGGGHKLSRKSRCSITSLDAQLPVGSNISSDGNYVSIQNVYTSIHMDVLNFRCDYSDIIIIFTEWIL